MAGIPAGWEIETAPSAPASEQGAAPTAALPEGFEIETTPPQAPSGLEFTVTDDRPDYGVPMPNSREELQTYLRKMTEMGKSEQDIRSYIEEAGYVLDEGEGARFGDLYQPGTPVDFEADEVQQDEISNAEAWWEGVKSGALRGFGDEWQGFWGATGNKLGTALGLNESTADFWDIYRQLQQKNEAYRDRAFKENAIAYGLGFVPGALTGPSFARISNAPANASRAERLGRLAAVGGIEGAISGAGNADPGAANIVGDAVTGGVVGAALAPVVAPIAERGARSVMDLYRRFGPRRGGNAMNDALTTLTSRAPQDAEAMAARAAEFRSGGVEPRLVDVVDESGRGVIRDASGKMTPAREDVVRHADEVYVDAQDRVANQARRNITDRPETARQLSEQIAEEQRLMGPRFDAVRDNPVTLTPEVTRALNTQEGRSVLRTIGRLMTPEEREPLDALIKSLQKSAKAGTPEEQAAKLVPGFERMSPEAQAQIMAQLPLEDATPVLTVDIADKFARRITEAAKDKPSLMRVARNYAETIRGAARQQYPEYDAALNEFAAAARVGNAAEGTGPFAGRSDFLRTPPDQYRPGEAEATPAAINAPGEGQFWRGGQPLGDAPGFYSRDRAVAEQYQDLRGPGGEVRSYDIELNNPAPADVVQREAVALGFDPEDLAAYTEASVFDPDLFGTAEVAALQTRLREMGYDGAELPDLTPPGNGQGEFIATVPFDRAQVRSPQPGPATVSEQDALRARARDDIVDKATSGSGAQAMSVARQVSRGSAQRQRNEALLGPEQARRFERGMRSEVERVDNTRFIDPRTGSQTASRLSDEEGAMDDIIEAAGHASIGNKTGMIYSARRWLRQNRIRGVDAERLVREAISDNPETVNNLIEFLGKRGVETSRARGLIRGINAVMAGRTAGALTAPPSESQARPTPSIRALHRNATRIDQGEQE
jgi:hypothetical protein